MTDREWLEFITKNKKDESASGETYEHYLIDPVELIEFLKQGY